MIASVSIVRRLQIHTTYKYHTDNTSVMIASVSIVRRLQIHTTYKYHTDNTFVMIASVSIVRRLQIHTTCKYYTDNWCNDSFSVYSQEVTNTHYIQIPH